MIIFPAIDLKNKKGVRLTQGDFATTETVAENPVKAARSFGEYGAEWLHVVDLDGAVAGAPMNSDVIFEVEKNTDLNIQVGGGIRSIKDIRHYLDNGIQRVILGSIAVDKPELVKEAVAEYGEHIAVGIDAKNGMVRSGGWLVESEVNFLDLAEEMDSIGVKTLIYTDISKDGTLSGPNLKDMELLNLKLDANIIASGGIKDIDDITKLAEIGLYGAICGKSLYSGSLSLPEAIDVAGSYK